MQTASELEFLALQNIIATKELKICQLCLVKFCHRNEESGLQGWS